MKRITLTLVALLLPVAAFALDFTNTTGRYSDAPFDTATTAGVSVLTNLNAVSGNPDGTFAPGRTVNRAEFLKILFLSDAKVSVSANDAANCFPDVRMGDWFSKYVCLAKTRDTVGGYPDGTFKPAQTVNYAEAVKMLGEAFNLKGGDATNPWYQRYVDAGNGAGVLLTQAIGFDMPLTRGEVARLVAAYRANSDGQLTQYRAFERGEAVSMSSSSSSSVSSMSSVSSASSASSASSVSSASSSSSALPLGIFPARSQFLLTGRQSAVAVDGFFTSPNEDAAIRYVDFTLYQQVKSIDHLVLVDANGTQIMTLTLSGNNNTDNLKWHGETTHSGSYILHKGVATQLGLEAVLKNVGNGGVPNELFETQNFSMTAQGTSGASYNLVPTSTDYPMHQTSDAHVLAVRNAGSGSATMQKGVTRLIGKFAVSGETMTGGELLMNSIDFILQSTNVSVSHIRIGGNSVIQQADCSTDSTQMSHVTCSVIPSAFKNVGSSPTIISVYADVDLAPTATNGTMQLTFPGRGQIGQDGALHWEDNVGHYNWVEGFVPFENGTLWTVTQ